MQSIPPQTVQNKTYVKKFLEGLAERVAAERFENIINLTSECFYLKPNPI